MIRSHEKKSKKTYTEMQSIKKEPSEVPLHAKSVVHINFSVLLCQTTSRGNYSTRSGITAPPSRANVHPPCKSKIYAAAITRKN